MATNIDLLVSAKKIAGKIQDAKCIYSNSGVGKRLSTVLKSKKTNCANYVCLVLQDMGLLEKGSMFYFDSGGNIKTQGDAGAVNGCLKTYFDKAAVGGKKGISGIPLQPGDICGWKGHTNIFAGYKGGNKSHPVWWDAGRSGTTDGKPESGYFNKIHRERPMSTYCLTTILRLKSTAAGTGYYSPYTGKAVKLDTILKAVGVPARYRGSKGKREPLAEKNGITGYKGTLTQNMKLIKKAKKGTLKKV